MWEPNWDVGIRLQGRKKQDNERVHMPLGVPTGGTCRETTVVCIVKCQKSNGTKTNIATPSIS